MGKVQITARKTSLAQVTSAGVKVSLVSRRLKPPLLVPTRTIHQIKTVEMFLFVPVKLTVSVIFCHTVWKFLAHVIMLMITIIIGRQNRGCTGKSYMMNRA